MIKKWNIIYKLESQLFEAVNMMQWRRAGIICDRLSRIKKL